MSGASPTAAGRPGARRRIGTAVVAVLVASGVLGGCSFPVLYAQRMSANTSGEGAFDSARLPAAAQPYVQWIMKAGTICAEATPEIVAAVIDVENHDWYPRMNEGMTGDVAFGLAQFLRGTWNAHGVDADGNGVKDIFNAADAILSAGHYLCYLADVVRGYLKEGKIPNVRPPGTEKNVRDLMIVGYNKGEGIWLRREWNHVKINFDANGIPDSEDGGGTSGQKYLRLVNTRINAFRSPDSGGAPVSGVRDQMVDKAEGELRKGIHEWVNEKGRKNCNPYGYCAPWCAMFTSWVWKQGGFKFSSPRVEEFYNFGKRNGTFGTDFRRAQPGDTVIFSKSDDPFYHIGLIVKVWVNDGTIETIEGNTGNGVVGLHKRFTPSDRHGIGFVAPVPGK